MSLSLWNSWISPFDELKQMQRDIDQLFERRTVPTGNNNALWRPTCDIRETEKEFLVHAELPGVKKEDISIEVHDGVLTITGEKKLEKKEDNEKFHRTERSYGKFVRSMMVPDGTKQEQIQAKFENGVLELSFPKPALPAKPEPKKITIQ